MNYVDKIVINRIHLILNLFEFGCKSASLRITGRHPKFYGNCVKNMKNTSFVSVCVNQK